MLALTAGMPVGRYVTMVLSSDVIEMVRGSVMIEGSGGGRRQSAGQRRRHDTRELSDHEKGHQ